MFGGGSIQLARVFGVRIGVDASWFLVLFLIIWSLSGYYDSFALAVISALLFFLSILLHELGHAVVAMRNGIPILGIDLWMFGGVAKMERDTDSPGVEFKVAVAGPLVTLAIVVLCFGLGSLIGSADETLQGTQFDDGADGAVAVLGYLASINLLVLLFNLIPGFPLDGGRIARAIAWWRTGDRNRATRFAARLGRGFSFLMVAAGGFMFIQGNLIGGVWLAFIGIFLGQAARSAEVQSAISGRIEGLRVEDVMDDEPVAVPAELTLDRAADEFFLRYGWPWFPVIDGSARFVGLLDRGTAEGVDTVARASTTAGEILARDEGSLTIRDDAPLEAALGNEALRRLGALMAIDRDGRLSGVITANAIGRALRSPAPITDVPP